MWKKCWTDNTFLRYDLLLGPTRSFELTMRQVFLSSPWIHPEEPAPLRNIIETLGRRVSVTAGTALPHGEGHSYVGFLEKGLGAFTFEDHLGKRHIFALIIPGRVFGDLDALTRERLNLKGEVIRPSSIILLERDRWEAAISASPELLKLYAQTAMQKQESQMEGMIANFTMDLASRVRALLRSVIEAYYPVKENDWNPLPIKLSVTEMSETLAANRSSVSLLISEWADADLLRRDGRRIIVHGSLLKKVYDWIDRVPPDDETVPDPGVLRGN